MSEGNSDLDLVILDSPDFKRLKTIGFRYLLMNQTGNTNKSTFLRVVPYLIDLLHN